MRRTVLRSALLLSFCLALNIVIAQPQKTFKAGEYLKYSLHYGIIRGGEAVLEVRDKIDNDKKVNNLYLNAVTIGFANTLYNVNDTYQSFTNPDTDLPYRSIRDIREGSYKHYSEQTFDHWTRSDSTIVFTTKKGKVLSPKNSNDILSALYYLRNMLIGKKIKIGDTLVVQTYFTDEVYTMRVRFMGYETISTKVGRIQCMKFLPVVITGRVFKKKDDMLFWLSNDNNFIPVRFKFNIVVGAVYCDLIDYKNLIYPLAIEKP